MFSFRQYPNITKIVIPNNIQLSTRDFSGAFANMNSLTNVVFEHPNVTNMYSAYKNCTRLNCAPSIGPNVTDMSSMYEWCYYMKHAPSCPDSVINMSRSYCDCHNITGPAVCGNNVVDMSYAYRWCYNLTDITIPESVTSIGFYAFSNTAYYNDVDNWINGILVIDKYIIDVNPMTKEIDPNLDVKYIAEGALTGCYSLEIIKLFANLTRSSLRDCTNIKTIIIKISIVLNFSIIFTNKLRNNN